MSPNSKIYKIERRNGLFSINDSPLSALRWPGPFKCIVCNLVTNKHEHKWESMYYYDTVDDRYKDFCGTCVKKMVLLTELIKGNDKYKWFR